ncbi:MAG: dephospho-CoA kinase [Bacteroidetes bacterium]|nr:MAG: dephospho-CoA kinase [Bacteroidota bacterium]
MRKVAVTGNIGSGKTAICSVFEVLGIPVFYADKEAKKLYADPEVLKKITEKFGTHVVTPNNTLDTRALASIIFNDKKSLEFVNQLIHPRVFELFDQWCLSQSAAPYCMHEAALVYESGSQNLFDHIIVVHAPEEILLDRVIKRDGISMDQARERLNNQMSQTEKISLAHYTLLNDNSDLIIPQILKIDKELRSKI